MDNVTLNIEKRVMVGGTKPGKERKEGYVPGIIYGRGQSPATAKINASDLQAFISKHGKNSVFTTEFAAEHDLSALIKDIQYHPITKDIVHVDLQRVSMDEPLQTAVPVRVIGSGWIERDGGVVQHQLHEVMVECLPGDVPKYLEADITALTPGHSLTAAQLKVPERVTLVTAPDDIVLSVTNSKLELEGNWPSENLKPTFDDEKPQTTDQ